MTQQIVVMGVSGSGKSTIAHMLAQALGWSFAEGDGFHPEENVQKMSSGRPLTDQDRVPWLLAIRDWMTREALAGKDCVVSCSALRRTYRDILRQGPGDTTLVWLDVDEDTLAGRLQGRQEHFMPAGLLGSQLQTLEALTDDEDGFAIDGAQAPTEIVARILQELHTRAR